MNIIGNRIGIALTLLWGISFLPGRVGALQLLNPGEENVSLFNDQFPTVFYSPSTVIAAGDFNGDGKTDIALSLPRTLSEWEINLFLGRRETNGYFSKDSAMRVRVPVGHPFTPRICLADLDGDGRAELIVSAPVTNGIVDIIKGSSAPPPAVDLGTGSGDLRLLGKPNSVLGTSMTTGDFNGDGIQDLFLGAPGVNEGYLLMGGAIPLLGSVNLGAAHPLITISGNEDFGRYSSKANFNRDGKEDLVISARNARGFSGEIHVLFGRASFPTTWSLGSPDADVRIWGDSGSGVFSPAAGDVTGDNRDELVLQKSVGGLDSPVWMIAGNDVDSGRSILDLSTSSPNAVEIHPLLSPSKMINGAVGFGDFDGDGIQDLIARGYHSSVKRIYGILSSDFGHGTGMDLHNLETPSLILDGSFQDSLPAEVSGDGRSDLLAYDYLSDPAVPPYGVFRTYWGFEPLRNPAILVQPLGTDSARVTLNLSVGGTPTEMKLSGDLSDSFRDQWIPFRTSLEANWTADAGPKMIQVIFRNTAGRTSEPATASAVLAVPGEGVRVSTNRLAPGTVGRWEVSMTIGARLRARVFSMDGQEVISLEDSDRAAGIWPITWDGSNAGGQRVAPGVYLLLIEIGDQTHREKIAVTGR